MKGRKKDVVPGLKRKRPLLLAGCLCILVAAVFLVVNVALISIPASVKGSLFSDSQPANAVSGDFMEDERAPEGMKLVAENQDLAMFVNQATSEMAVLDKDAEEWWYSGPSGTETAASGAANKSKAILQIEYYDMHDMVGVLDSYTASVKEKNFGYEFIENGIRMIFQIGKVDVTKEMLPAVVGKEKFESRILPNLSGEEKELVEKYYVLDKLSEMENSVVADIYREQYTTIDETAEYYFLDSSTPKFKLEPLYFALYETAGYSAEDVAEDNKEVGYQIEVDTFIQFTIPVEFTLEGNSLKASIPASEIEIPEGCHLNEIALMPYFGCAGLDEEGYLFVPDGSGALIHFNNNAKQAYAYSLPVYGRDDGMEQTEVGFSTARASAPVFGIVYEDTKAMLAVIEEGESHAAIEAAVSGSGGDQNWVGARFNITPTYIETYSGSMSTVSINMYQEEPYGGATTIRYLFTDSAESDYSGLAGLYREYLREKGILTKQTDITGFNVKLISTITKETSFLGIPYETEQVVTSFSQASEIVSQLKEAGVTDLNVGITSWFGGGIQNDPVTGQVRVTSALGGEKDLRQLLSEMETGGELALGADLMKVYAGWPYFNHFINSSRFLNNALAKGYSFNPATLMADEFRTPYYFLSPRYAKSVLEDYAASVNRYDVSGLWYTDVGTVLGSDFSGFGTIDRESAKALVTEAVAGIADGNRITMDNPNQYLWKYADTMVNLPLSSSNHTIIDESVPFLQMVLSGSISYSSEAFNRSGDMDGYFLKAVETGGAIYYEWIYQSDVAVSQWKGAESEEIYSMSYETWIDRALEQYTRMKTELSCVEGKEITHHSTVEDGVTETRYGDISVIVNYNEYDVTVDGEIVGARDFKVVR